MTTDVECSSHHFHLGPVSCYHTPQRVHPPSSADVSALRPIQHGLRHAQSVPLPSNHALSVARQQQISPSCRSCSKSSNNKRSTRHPQPSSASSTPSFESSLRSPSSGSWCVVVVVVVLTLVSLCSHRPRASARCLSTVSRPFDCCCSIAVVASPHHLHTRLPLGHG